MPGLTSGVMPFHVAVNVTIDRDLRLVRTRYHGEVWDADLKTAHEELSSAGQLGEGWRQLIDLGDVTGGDLPSAAVAHFARMLPIFQPSSRRAIVAPHDVLYGMARMYAARRRASAGEVRVFRVRSEALRWLDVPAELT